MYKLLKKDIEQELYKNIWWSCTKKCVEKVKQFIKKMNINISLWDKQLYLFIICHKYWLQKN